MRLNVAIKYRIFGYFLFCGLAVAMAEIYKNWMVMLQYDEPSVVLVSSVIWEYVAYSLIAIIFPVSYYSSSNIWRRWMRVIITAILFTLLYVSILSLIEWLEFGRQYSLYKGWKFSLFHIPYVLAGYAFISFLVYQLNISLYKSTKYSHIKLSQLESKQIYSMILSLLVEQQYFLRSKLKITDVSTRLEIPINKVSRAINENFLGSFSDLVNHHRINHAKKLLSDGTNNDKLYAIALDSGFSNKVTFHQQFKKAMGMSPQEYRAQQVAHSGNLRVS